jgi:hypothetical protein
MVVGKGFTNRSLRVNYPTVVGKGFVNRHLRVDYSTVFNKRFTTNSICILLKEKNIKICSEEDKKQFTSSNSIVNALVSGVESQSLYRSQLIEQSVERFNSELIQGQILLLDIIDPNVAIDYISMN